MILRPSCHRDADHFHYRDGIDPAHSEFSVQLDSLSPERCQPET